MDTLTYIWDITFAFAIALSLVQAVMLFVLMACGAPVIMGTMPLPKLESVRGKFFYNIVIFFYVAHFVSVSYTINIGAALAVGIVCLLIWAYPLLGAFPVWFLVKIIGITPSQIVKFPFRLFSVLYRRSKTGATYLNSAIEQQVAKSQKLITERPQGLLEALRETESQTPPATAIVLDYTAACEVMCLAPSQFEQVDLTSSYRDLMKSVPKGQHETKPRIREINTAYELILDHHEWSR